MVAGSGSLLSPFALLLLPIPLESGGGNFKLNQVSLGLGFVFAFTAVGVFSVNIGTSNFVYLVSFRMVCASVMATFAIPIVFTAISEKTDLLHFLKLDKFYGQFTLGILLGLTWAPCVGPELVNIAIASNAQTLIQIVSVIVLFSFGAIVPLIMIGVIYKRFIMHWRYQLHTSEIGGMKLFGVILLLTGLLIMTGLDQSIFHQSIGALSNSGNFPGLSRLFE